MSSALVFGPHVVVGALALALFWRTLLSVKGGASHRRFGRYYMLILLPLLLSVLPITAQAALHQGPAKVVQLVYLAVVVTTAGWTAWRAIKDRADPDRFRGRTYRILAGAMLGLGALLLVIGILTEALLAVGFSVIGIVYGGAMLGFLGARAEGEWWLGWHLNGICLLFAATHASFIGLVMRHLLPEYDGEAMHALTQLGTIAFAYVLRQWMGWRWLSRPRAVAAH